MAKLQKLSKVLVDFEVTQGQGKASNSDFLSSEVSANLVAGTPTVNASIVDDSGTLYRFLGSSDEAGVDLTTETFTNESRWANLGSAWDGTEEILLIDDSNMGYTIESIERNNINGSYVSCPTLSGSESSSGTINTELAITDVQATEKGQVSSHKFLVQATGKYVQGGATIDTGTNSIAEVAEDAGTHDLYRFAKIGEPIVTLAVRAIEGGSTENIIDFGGVVTNSCTVNLSSGELATLSYDVGGTNFFLRAGDIVPSNALGCNGEPFVVKKAYFSKADGSTLKATDLTITLNNDVTDRSFVQDSGVSDRVTVGKGVEVSFGKDKTNQDDLLAFKGNDSIGLFLLMRASNGSEFVVSIPNMNYTQVEGGNDAGVLTESLTLQGFNDANGNAIYIASKR